MVGAGHEAEAIEVVGGGLELRRVVALNIDPLTVTIVSMMLLLDHRVHGRRLWQRSTEGVFGGAVVTAVVEVVAQVAELSV